MAPTIATATDKATGYKTTSILSTPIKDVNGTTIGVLQAINKLTDEPVHRIKQLLPAPESDRVVFDDGGTEVGRTRPIAYALVEERAHGLHLLRHLRLARRLIPRLRLHLSLALRHRPLARLREGRWDILVVGAAWRV